MARCKSCGKVNRDGAHFCQDCGNSFDGPAGPAGGGLVGKDRGRPAEQAAERPPGGTAERAGSPLVSGGAGKAKPTGSEAVVSAAAGAAEPQTCASCGTANPGGVVFCKQCGVALAGGTGPHGRVSCAQCGQPTPSGFTFCQHCGHRLMGEREPSGPRSPVRPAPPELPSAEVPPPVIPRAAALAIAAAPVASSPESGKPGAPRTGGTALRGRLIVMRRDGSDGEAIALSGELFDIGRTAANKNFSDDPFLAARHVRFFMHGGGVRVRPVDLVNGVFIQLREPHELQANNVFYIGRELIRYEPLAPEERDPAPAIEHGVRVFGSTPRESWARLRQLTTSALVRDVWHLSRAEVLLGREEGDIVFPDDEFMSRRHALITRVGGRVRLEDQHSSNGTYVRLRGERDVQPNDVLRVGDQVLRYEP